jgi:CSLREA domain-containing protein
MRTVLLRRPARLAALGLLALATACCFVLTLPATSALAATFDVTSTTDAPDATSGDGICASTAGGNPCTLRAAVQTANQLGGSHVIRLLAGTYLLNHTGAGENAAATGDLDVISGANITVRSANTAVGGVTIDGNATDRIFDVRSGGTLTVIGLILTNGTAPTGEDGGAIRSNGTLTLLGTTVSGSSVVGAGSTGGGGLGIDSGTAPSSPPR